MESLDALVDETLARVGSNLVVGAPLGCGKPNHVVNAFYRRAKLDPSLQFTLLTALSLDPPRPSGELERRLMEPIVGRLWGDYPRLDYLADLARGDVPENVEISEFFFAPGSALGVPLAQQSYRSTSYTHVARDLLDARVNVVLQMVAREEREGRVDYSLSSNPDVTLDLLPALRRAPWPAVVVGQANARMPFLGRDALLAPGDLDLVIDDRALDFEPFATPPQAVGAADHLIGLQASALVRDGGTLQIGIGSLSDAIGWSLLLRHRDPDRYRALLGELDVDARFGELIERVGGTAPFERGLYADTEMLVEAFLHLMEAGILRRRVYDDLETQTRADEGRLDPEAARVPATLVHAAFFLGPRGFYERLRRLPRAERDLICMTGVARTNRLRGDEVLRARQRRDARFFNTALLATLDGAVTSDGLEDGRTLSGVGGQYEFVAMAHELSDARSVLMLRATRDDRGTLRSNVRFRYGHTTIPRYLRDLVITEYGIADLRGQTDCVVYDRMLSVADARFQEELLREAVAAGKLPASYRLPDRYRRNLPDAYGEAVERRRGEGLFPRLPFGSDLTDVESDLADALRHLAALVDHDKAELLKHPHALVSAASPPAAALPYLERLRLDRPEGLEEHALRVAAIAALALRGYV
jgi:acyl-CoA hydrolase